MPSSRSTRWAIPSSSSRQPVPCEATTTWRSRPAAVTVHSKSLALVDSHLGHGVPRVDAVGARPGLEHLQGVLLAVVVEARGHAGCVNWFRTAAGGTSVEGRPLGVALGVAGPHRRDQDDHGVGRRARLRWSVGHLGGDGSEQCRAVGGAVRDYDRTVGQGVVKSGQRGSSVMAVGDDAQDDARADGRTHLAALDDLDSRTLRWSQVQQLRIIGRIGRGQPRLDGVPRGGRGLSVPQLRQVDGQQFLGQRPPIQGCADRCIVGGGRRGRIHRHRQVDVVAAGTEHQRGLAGRPGSHINRGGVERWALHEGSGRQAGPGERTAGWQGPRMPGLLDQHRYFDLHDRHLFFLRCLHAPTWCAHRVVSPPSPHGWVPAHHRAVAGGTQPCGNPPTGPGPSPRDR